MSSALHTARSGLDAQDMRMRVISNNLANVNTTGFKRDRASFETLSYQMMTQAGTPSSAENRYATGLNLGTGVAISGTARIDTQGTFATTGNGLDVFDAIAACFPGGSMTGAPKLPPGWLGTATPRATTPGSFRHRPTPPNTAPNR